MYLPVGEGFYHRFPLMPSTDYDKKCAFSWDLGRFEVTKAESDKNSFRVLTWRNIALTAPNTRQLGDNWTLMNARD